jgi:glycosyltransferase involved in cell wall biosynthesis
MILFLNFAPIEFKGGAERWTKGIVNEISKVEKTRLISVDPVISDFYGQLVLHRKFSEHTEKLSLDKDIYLKLSLAHFNPFSNEFKKVKQQFKESRINYVKFEFLEILICLYFGGLDVFSKTVAGIHSPLIYPSPKTILNHFHNWLYSSKIFGYFLSKCVMVHVLNKRDEKFLKINFKIKNVKQIYDGVNINKIYKDSESPNRKKSLNVIIVGELSIRKGTDIVAEIIKKAPVDYHFSVIGEGPLKYKILDLDQSKVTYYGYINDENQLRKIYSEHDVLLFPSRAETFGLVMPEALSCGLVVLNSNEVKLDMPNNIEFSSLSENPLEYLLILKKINKLKHDKKINRQSNHKFAYENFSNDVLYPKFVTELISI